MREFIKYFLVMFFMFSSFCDLYSQNLWKMYKHYDAKTGVEPPKIRATGRKYVVNVRNEEDFKNVNITILNAIKSGEKNIVVRMKRGTYHFHRNHINLYGLNNPETSIIIEGNGSVIYPEFKEYSGSLVDSSIRCCVFEGKISPESIFITDNGEILDVWTSMRHSMGAVEVKDKNTASISTEFCGHMSTDSEIRIPHWYYSTQYQISNISDQGVITFTPKKSKEFDVDYRKTYVLDYDFAVSGESVRYQCFNLVNDEVPYYYGKKLFFPAKYKSIYDCLAAQFIVLESTTLSQFIVKGLNCYGSRGGGHFINLSGVTAQRISFEKCHFKGIKSTLLMINRTDNVSFSNNTVKQCFAQGIYSTNGSKNTIVNNCLFSNNGQNMLQHMCIYCAGEDYHIYNNTIRDFAYAAIFVGIHHSNKNYNKSGGVIEDNDIYYSEEYFKNFWRYTLADGGAIYISTKNDEVIIRNNYIHDYIGISGNRAIFGDAGAKNVIIYNNVIKRVPNYYAIDLYRVESVDKYISDANSGNHIFANCIDGAYKIGGRDDISCSDGGNILISNTYNRYNEPQISDSKTIEDNIEIKSKVSRKEKRNAKQRIPTYNKLKPHIENDCMIFEAVYNRE